MNELTTEPDRCGDRRPILLCPLCETENLIRRHCKTLCLRCGYVESCEDNFVPNAANPNE